MKIATILILVGFFYPVISQESSVREDGFPVFSGPYIGQKPAGSIPEVFAPGVINTDAQIHSCVTISPDGKSIFWSQFSKIKTIRQERIWYTHCYGGTWSIPEVAMFSGTFRDGAPRFSFDGKKLYFTSCRPLDDQDKTGDANTWYVSVQDTVFGAPRCLDYPVNSQYQEWCPCVTKNGNLYFMYREESDSSWDIFVSKYRRGEYRIPQRLPDTVNSPYVDGFLFVDHDERFITFYSERPGGVCANGELYISYGGKDGSWSQAIAMGNQIGTSFTRFSGLSPDGSFFFFSRQVGNQERIFWVDAKILDSYGR